MCSRHGYLHPELFESLSPCLFAVLTSKIAQFREDFGLPLLNRALTSTKDTKRWGTNSEGPVKYCRCTFLDMPRRIAQERVPTASNVGSRDVTWASQPTPVIPFGVFWRVSRGPFLRQSEVVTETQFLIGLRVLCGLLCSALSTLHWVPVGNGFREAKRDASRPWTSRTLRARHSSLQACQHRVLCSCGYAALCPCALESLSP